MCQTCQGPGAVLHVRGTTSKGRRLLVPLEFYPIPLPLGCLYYHHSPGYIRVYVDQEGTGQLTGHSETPEINIIKSSSLLESC